MNRLRCLFSKKLLCLTAASLLLLSGCALESKEDADVRELLQDALKKTKKVSAFHVEGSDELQVTTTYYLKDERSEKEYFDSVVSESADFYMQDDLPNYYAHNTDSNGTEYINIVKEGKGLSFTKQAQEQNFVAREDELTDYSSFQPLDLYLHEIWIEDIGDFATYTLKEDGEESIVTLKVDDLEALSKSETNKYYKDDNASIDYDSLSLIYRISKKGYISAVSFESGYVSEEKDDKGEDLGFTELVTRIEEKTKYKVQFVFSDFNKQKQLDFSLLEQEIKK